MMRDATPFSSDRLRSILEICAFINSQKDPDLLLDEIMDHAIGLLNAEKGLILMGTGPQHTPEVRVARFIDSDSAMDPKSMSRTVINRVSQDGNPVLVSRVSDLDEAEMGPSATTYGIKSILCVPLKAGEESVGVIYLDTTREEHFFVQADLDFLESFSNLAGIAIRNARHGRQIEMVVEKRTRQLRNANEELTQANYKLKEAQLRLVQQEKMASLGQLAAGITHEINTPLAALASAADGFSRGLAHLSAGLGDLDANGLSKAQRASAHLQGMSDIAQTACQRISEIVKTMGNFSQLDQEDLKDVDINACLMNTLTFLDVKYRDKVDVDLGPLPPVRCRSAQLNQAFLALLVYLSENASGHSPIRLESRATENFIEVIFSNTTHWVSGTGVKRVFDPDFNANGDRVTMDLRLSLAYRFVAENGGELLVSSEQDAGTTFSIMLPLKGDSTV